MTVFDHRFRDSGSLHPARLSCPLRLAAAPFGAALPDELEQHAVLVGLGDRPQRRYRFAVLRHDVRSKRAMRSASAMSASGSTLIATSRPSFVSVARYTSPMPPAPTGARISYDPRRRPG